MKIKEVHDGINFHRLAAVIQINRSVPTSQSVAVPAMREMPPVHDAVSCYSPRSCAHIKNTLFLFVFVLEHLFQSSQIFPDWLSTSRTTPHQAYSVYHWPRMCIESEAMQASKWGLSQMGLVRCVNRSTNFAWTVM